MSDDVRRATGPRLNFGALVMLCTFLLAQTVAAVWWAASIDSQVSYNTGLVRSVEALRKSVADIGERTVRLEEMQKMVNRQIERVERRSERSGFFRAPSAAFKALEEQE